MTNERRIGVCGAHLSNTAKGGAADFGVPHPRRRSLGQPPFQTGGGRGYPGTAAIFPKRNGSRTPFQSLFTKFFWSDFHRTNLMRSYPLQHN